MKGGCKAMEIIEDIQPVAIKTCKYFGINAVSEL